MMARVAVGRPCPRVLASVGADVNPLSFYSTSYSASYGTGRFVPRPGRHSGTGYAANLRPVLHYQPSLDRTDNPPLGLSLLDSLQSVTHRHFLPLCRPDGSEPLPQIRGKRESAYLRDTAVERGGKMLHQSEYQGHFVPLATGPAGPVNLQHRTIGQQQGSGFTQGSEVQPFTFVPRGNTPSISGPDDSGHQTRNTIMKTDFLPSQTLQGSECWPRLARGSVTESGFSREISAPLRAGVPECAEARTRSQQSRAAPGGTVSSRKELSGFSINNTPYLSQPLDPPSLEHFLTNYNIRFVDPAPVGVFREGWVRGGIHRPRGPGLTARDDRITLGERGTGGPLHPQQSRVTWK